MVSNSPWNKLLSGCELLREGVGEPRVWDGAAIPITTAVAHGPRGERAGMALPALLHPWQVDGNSSWVCSSRTRTFQLCSLRDSLRRAPGAKGSPAPGGQGGEAAPALGRWGWRMGVKEGRWMKDRAAHSKPPACGGQFLTCSAPSPPARSDGEGFCLALRTEPTSPQFPGQTPDLDPSDFTFPRLLILLQPG